MSSSSRDSDVKASTSSVSGETSLHSQMKDRPFLERLAGALQEALEMTTRQAVRLQQQPPEEQSRTHQLETRLRRLRDALRSTEILAASPEEAAERISDAREASTVVSNLRDAYVEDARARGLTFNLDLPEEAVTLHTDMAALRQALGHLVANAIAFASEDGAVSIRACAAEEAVIFHVEDTGSGLPEGAVDDLFEPFSQQAHPEEPAPLSAGLELPLAQALAERLGGTISAESDPEAGSTFTLRVPLRLEASSGEAAEAASGQPRLLVVEDNEITQRLLRRMLEERYAVDVEARAEAAIAQAQDTDYDSFVLDINLEGRRTGIEVLRAAREAYNGPVPAVACTAYAFDEHQRQFRQVGFDEIVTKPLTKDELLGAVERAIENPSGGERLDVTTTSVELPPLPTTLIEVAELAARGRKAHDIEALTQAVRRDQVVSFWLLRHINSAYYNLSGKVESVERAVRYLGFRPVCNLVLSKVLARSLADTDTPSVRQVQRYLMRTSLVAAFLSRALAQRLDLEVSPETAYTAGLLAQLGRLALLSAEGETYARLWFEEEDSSGDWKGPPPRGQEILHCEANYLHFGLAVAEKFELPDELEAVLRHHPSPADARSHHRPFAPLVGLALSVAADAEQLRAEEDAEGAFGTRLAQRADRLDATQQIAEEEDIGTDAITYAVGEAGDEAQAFAQRVLEGASRT